MTLEEICSRIGDFIDAPEPKPCSFEELARALFAFQFENNSTYRAICQSHGVTPLTLASVDQIPAVITRAFKDFEVSALPCHARTAVFHSSGTTGQQPSRHFHSADTLRLYQRSLLRWFSPHLLPATPRANFLILTPSAAEARNSSLVHMFETVSRRFARSEPVFCAGPAQDGSWLLDFERTLRACDDLNAAGLPVVICGTAFSFVHLCDYLEEAGRHLTFPPGSRVLETGGYKGRSRSLAKTELHEMITERLSIAETHIIAEYGMSELSSQAYDRQCGSSSARVFQFPPWARVSILSPETGEPVADGGTGLLRVLDLANAGSVLAVQTEDLARRRGGGFELLGRGVAAEPRGCSLMLAAS